MMQFFNSESDEKNTALNYLGLLKTQMRSDGSELMPAVEVKFCRSPLEKKCFQAGKLLRIVFHFHNKLKIICENQFISLLTFVEYILSNY